MEQYIVSARKYRPATFGTVVGQHALTTTLKNAIASDKLAHAYLFTGSRGIGKTSCARIFAKTINCTNRTPEGEACNQCESCRDFNSGTSLNVLELDAASHNGVDEIKSIIDQVIIPPVMGRYKVFIIDEVHMLSTAAFNAFLKTLEEPPSYVIFILATTEKHKIIPTILSRCQIYDFSRITVPDIVAHLSMVASREGITAEPAALNVIARKADGAMRDALSIFDQVAASSGGNITYQSAIDNLNVLDHAYYSRLLKAFLEKDVTSALLIYKEIRDKGFDSHFFINGLADYLRDIMVASSPTTLSLLEAVDEVKEEMSRLAAKCTPSFLYQAMDICNDADLNYRKASNKQFFIELALIKLCQPDSLLSVKKGKDKGQTLMPVFDGVTPQAPSVAGQTAAQPSAPQSQPVAPARPATVVTPASSQTPLSATLRNTTAKAHDNAYRRPQFDFNRQKSAGVSAPSADYGQPDRQFTEEQLLTLWQSYIDDNPHKPLLVSLMQRFRPKRIKECRFGLEVDSEISLKTLNDDISALTGYLREQLGNRHFTLETSVSADATPPPSVMSEREALKAMADQSPEIRNFIEALKLTLI